MKHGLPANSRRAGIASIRFIATVILGLVVVALLPAQLPGTPGVAITTDDGRVQLYERSFALVIANGDYTDAWPQLPGAFDDAERVTGILEAHGFDVTVVRNVDAAGLYGSFEDFVDAYGYDSANRLVVYYAGHGYSVEMSFGGKLGFLAPVDAPDPRSDEAGFLSSALSMQQLEVFAQRATVGHMLFVLDTAVAADTFDLIAPRGRSVDSGTAEPVRQIITAGGANEPVSDMGAFADGFVRALEGEGDANDDGYVTGTELAAFISALVADDTWGEQTPRFGTVRNPNLSAGDMVFAVRAPTVTGVVVTGENVFEGARVVRGPDWEWGDQDGGPGRPGTITDTAYSSGRSNDWVYVEWDDGGGDGYRIGPGQFDLAFAEGAPVADDGVGPEPGGDSVVNEGNAYVGARVMRGPDWEWGDQDGGAGSPGTIINLDAGYSDGNQWIDVEWDNGEEWDYRVGPEHFDLIFYDGSLQALELGQWTEGRLSDSEAITYEDRNVVRYSLRVPTSGDLRIDLMSDAFDTYLYVTAPDGTVWRDDDGGTDRNSRLTIPDAAPGVYQVDASSYGGDAVGSYELRAEVLTAGPPVVIVPGEVVTQGNVYEGARVVRGPDWEWGDQDGGAGRPGTIVNTDSSFSDGQQWVDVEWDDGDDNNYRIGPDYFDLEFYAGAFQTRDEFSSDEEYGEYIRTMLQPGMRVRARVDYDRVSAGETGTYYGTNDGSPPAFVIWDEGKDFGGVWLEGVPREQEENAYWVPWHALVPTGSAPAPADVRTLPLDQWVDGELTGAETLRQDDRRVVRYRVELPSTGVLTVDLRSDDVDTYVYVTTPEGQRYSDDDGGTDRNSRLELDDAQPGVYLVDVTSYGGETPGMFELRASFTDASEERQIGADVVTEDSVYEGARVVRGPDWEWGDQDGGAGGVGTIVDTEYSIGDGEHWVWVEWDDGEENSYRIGTSEFDLRFAGQ